MGLANLTKVEFPLFRRASGLTAQQKFAYSFAVFGIFLVIYILLDTWGAAIVLAAGLWAIWNGNNEITVKEKKVFWTAIDVAIILSLVDYASILFKAAGLFMLLVVAHIAWLWLHKGGKK